MFNFYHLPALSDEIVISILIVVFIIHPAAAACGWDEFTFHFSSWPATPGTLFRRQCPHNILIICGCVCHPFRSQDPRSSDRKLATSSSKYSSSSSTSSRHNNNNYYRSSSSSSSSSSHHHTHAASSSSALTGKRSSDHHTSSSSSGKCPEHAF